MGSMEERQTLIEQHIRSRLQSERTQNDLMGLVRDILGRLDKLSKEVSDLKHGDISRLSKEIDELKRSGVTIKTQIIETQKPEVKQQTSRPFIPSLKDIDMKTSVADPKIKKRESNIQDSLDKLSEIEK